MEDNMKPVFYDLETLKSVFTGVFINEEGKERVFEISRRRNDYTELRKFLVTLKKQGYTLVGWNNMGFDWPILDALMRIPASSTLERILATQKKKCDEIIKSGDRWAHVIWQPEIPQLDLYRIGHFDNPARSTSLKALEFAMRLPDIVEFTVGFDKDELTDEELDGLIAYNIYDVKATKTFFEKKDQQEAIALRKELGARYGKDFNCSSDSSMASKIFQHRLEEQLGRNACYEWIDGERHTNQTKRESIQLGKLIFDYVEFDRPEFKSVRDWIANQTITETKGVFTEIPEDELGTLAEFTNLKKVKGKVKNLNCIVDGFQFDFGTGGIHGSVENKVFESDEDYVIIDSDVASLYPSIAIENNLYPEHLGSEFVRIYRDIREERFKHAKGTSENAALKLCLNSAYGNSNNPYSYLHDPQFTMSITVNGQLMLAMLAEQLFHLGELIQINTDGLTMRVPVEKQDDYMDVCALWENRTGLVLEHANYKKMFVRDVNNYLAIYEDGKTKAKGAYSIDRQWHQDQSMMVVRKAAYNYLVDNTPLRETIEECSDPYDFMLRCKVNKTDHLWLIGEDNTREELQRVTRYYISNSSKRLVIQRPPLSRKVTKKLKVLFRKHEYEPNEEQMALIKKGLKIKKQPKPELIGNPPQAILDEIKPRIRFANVNDGYNVTVANTMPDKLSDVNFDFYVDEAKKLVDVFE